MSADEIFLMQYYDPLKKFMHLKVRWKQFDLDQSRFCFTSDSESFITDANENFWIDFYRR